MTCGNKTFAAAPILQSLQINGPGDVNNVYTALTEDAAIPVQTGIDSFPAYLAGPPFNLDCATAKNFLAWPADIVQFWAPVVQIGSTIPEPDGSNCTPIFDGAGIVSCSYSVTVDDTIFGSVDWHSVDGFSTSGITWPLIIGTNCNKFQMQRVGQSGLGTTYLSFDCTVNRMTSVDFELWWCCASACCAPPVGTSAPRFLIPPPTNPTPVEERASTPLLYTPIYLSNHTFQFVANYGRVPKNG